jgi:hypothetical protein
MYYREVTLSDTKPKQAIYAGLAEVAMALRHPIASSCWNTAQGVQR